MCSIWTKENKEKTEMFERTEATLSIVFYYMTILVNIYPPEWRIAFKDIILDPAGA